MSHDVEVKMDVRETNPARLGAYIRRQLQYQLPPRRRRFWVPVFVAIASFLMAAAVAWALLSPAPYPSAPEMCSCPCRP